jgi:NADPH2 dehydrogenase
LELEINNMTVLPTKLFAPARVGVLDLKHRMVMAPLTRMRAVSKTAVPADYAADYYAQRASREYSLDE